MLILSVGLGLRWLPISAASPILDPLLQGDFGAALANLPHALPYLIMPGNDHRLLLDGSHHAARSLFMLEVLSRITSAPHSRKALHNCGLC